MGKRSSVFVLTLAALILLSTVAYAFSFSDLLSSISKIFSSIFKSGKSTDNSGPQPGGDNIICNPPYMRVGNDCCLDQDGNGICDRDETPQTTQAPVETETTQPPAAETATTLAQKHTTCENGMCVEKEGVGASECQGNGECKRMKCDAGYCKEINEKGQSECSIDSQCRHKVCNATHYCVEVMSKGASECQTTQQCQAQAPKHKACAIVGGILKCALVDGAGSDECRDDMSCYQIQNGKCENGMCVADGIGNTSCTLDSHCYHYSCTGVSCVKVSEPGESECQGPGDTQTCWVKDQFKEYHYECSNGMCVKVDGSGTNECDYAGQDPKCRHRVCQVDKCVEILSPGKSTCTIDYECAPTHGVCVNETCIQAPGQGRDECTTDGQCH